MEDMQKINMIFCKEKIHTNEEGESPPPNSVRLCTWAINTYGQTHTCTLDAHAQKQKYSIQTLTQKNTHMKDKQ